MQMWKTWEKLCSSGVCVCIHCTLYTALNLNVARSVLISRAVMCGISKIVSDSHRLCILKISNLHIYFTLMAISAAINMYYRCVHMIDKISSSNRFLWHIQCHTIGWLWFRFVLCKVKVDAENHKWLRKLLDRFNRYPYHGISSVHLRQHQFQREI